MSSGILNAMGLGGMDPFIFVIILLILIIALGVLFVLQIGKYNKLNRKFQAFMTGSDGASLEEEMAALFPTHPEALANTVEVLEKMDMTSIYNNFAYNNVFDIEGIIRYISLTVFFVFLTVQSVEKRRWL